ncbi:amyloid-beta A4 precursor protein-binding family A member 1-like [Betta splendens]|uniref:Amyloid-beta A4 precursor protein-binding family A member 1-like n=1 Tax=Betta splendens TaxID=158456 RepID=A0A6P7NWQ8_BETSP|nr:amyloid-beta A4 precursor protein-binding family A member 1-like [Betta splendens]
MSHKYQAEGVGGTEEREEHKGPLRSRQPNGMTHEEPPVRRSWRPCQMLNQDGDPNPQAHHHHHHRHQHHHHHPPTGRGPPRYSRRPPSGQGRGQGQARSPGLGPAMVSAKQDEGEKRDTESRSVQPMRPAVTCYRRHGDPNPRHRGHRQRQPVRKVQDSSLAVDQREHEAQAQSHQCSQGDPSMDQSQDFPHQTPVAVVTPNHLSHGPSAENQLLSQHTPSVADEDLQERKVECNEKLQKVKENENEQEMDCSTTGRSSCSLEDLQNEGGTSAERVEGDQEDMRNNVEEDMAAQGTEVTDLCSDTESAASLSMDGPLHSPPPLQSPTPPSSPDVPGFPQLDHFSEDTSMSPVPDHDLPEDEDDDDCSQSCSLSYSTSCSESHPTTYADFYPESHQKSYSESPHDSRSQPKSHPNSFPEPLKTTYPESHREPRWQPSHRTEPNEFQKPLSSHRAENSPPSPSRSCHNTQRPGRDLKSHHSPLDRSVGCRLHHYDGQSDSEGGCADQSPVPRSRRPPRPADPRAKSPPSGQSNSGEAHEDRNPEGLAGGESTVSSGNVISLAIKDIKEAIEEVKTKTVRSPYTPDHPVEPIWVMRQIVSPTEDPYPLPTTAEHPPPLPPQPASDSPSHFAPGPAPEPVSPPRAETSRVPHRQHYHQQNNHHHHGHQPQQRDNPRPLQTHAQPPHQQQQRQQQKPPPPQQRPQVQPQSPPQQPSVQEIHRALPPFPTFVDVPGPCDPEDLIDGIIFAATYLGCTHLLSERTPTKSSRMQQAQEAMNRVRAAQKQAKNRKKSPDSEVPSAAEVDLFMSTQRIKVLNADTQDTLMDLPLRTISYIADIGNMVVLMARGKMVRSRSAQENLDHTTEQTSMSHDDRRLYRMICHVFESEDAQLIAQSIGQSFSVAYQEFLRANGIDPEDLSQREYSDLLNTQDMYNDDLIHFSKSENCRDVYIEKQKGEILGVVIVESGWGSILPTVIIASMMHGGPAEKSGRLNIGDQIMTINGTSLVGLPLSTCQSIIKGLKSQSRIKMNIVRCPPVTTVLIRRPDLRYQLGFSVQNGIICSLMRGGIAERGGVRVGHRIIEINGQSVVATPHEKIVQILSNAMGEIHMKTMPAAMYRLLTAQEQPVYI